MTYENGERYDPAKPLGRMSLCPVDNCVVDRIYTEITQKEIDAYKKRTIYEYCSISTDDGDATLICDANILRESPVLASLIDTSLSLGEASSGSIQFSKDLVQARMLPIIAEKLVFQHTWKNSSYGEIPRDPIHYRELDVTTELALFIALDALEL